MANTVSTGAANSIREEMSMAAIMTWRCWRGDGATATGSGGLKSVISGHDVVRRRGADGLDRDDIRGRTRAGEVGEDRTGRRSWRRHRRRARPGPGEGAGVPPALLPARGRRRRRRAQHRGSARSRREPLPAGAAAAGRASDHRHPRRRWPPTTAGRPAGPPSSRSSPTIDRSWSIRSPWRCSARGGASARSSIPSSWSVAISTASWNPSSPPKRRRPTRPVRPSPGCTSRCCRPSVPRVRTRKNSAPISSPD